MAKKPKPKNITAATPSDNQHVNVSVRKIANGFVVSHSKSGDGDYQSTEHYHPTAPKISVNGVEPPASDKAARKAKLTGVRL